MAIEIVDLPIKNGDFPVRYVKLPEGTHQAATATVSFSAVTSCSHSIQRRKGMMSYMWYHRPVGNLKQAWGRTDQQAANTGSTIATVGVSFFPKGTWHRAYSSFHEWQENVGTVCWAIWLNDGSEISPHHFFRILWRAKSSTATRPMSTYRESPCMFSLVSAAWYSHGRK